MNDTKHEEGQLMKRILAAVMAVLIAVLSFTFAADRAMSPEENASLIESIDDKKDIVLALTASATLASTIISAIPSDTATPIADKLADLSGCFLIILTVLYAEKYLLTAIGAATFKILIPLACLAFIVFIFYRRDFFRQLIIRLLLLGILLYAMIPASIKVSDTIYETYKSSINSTIEDAGQLSNEADEMLESDENIWDKVTGAATNLKNKASDVLTDFTEALAVMVATTCLIPLAVILFFIWLMKTFVGISISKERILASPEHKHSIPKKTETSKNAPADQ